MPRTPPYIEPDWPAPASVMALCTTREAGNSAAPYNSFNLGSHVGDDDGAVRANRGLLGRILPPGCKIQWLSQVHGTRVVEALCDDAQPQADALWTESPGIACAVMTADCLPVLFCTAEGDRVAAAHAGWRGLLHGVLEASVATLAVNPAEIMAWLGPAIGPRAFEVGPEVREAFLAAVPDGDSAPVAACFAPSPGHDGYYLADLYSLARLRLRQMGIKRLFGGGFCTFSQPDRFYSYRRDGRTGRMASLILIRPD